MPIHTYEEDTRTALYLLPASGDMLFTEWIDKAVAAGVDREVLRSWPNWRARGMVRTHLIKKGDELRHVIERGES